MKKVLIPAMLMTIAFQAISANANTQGVIGVDERVQITEQNDLMLHRSVGLLEIRFGNDYYNCTGTVVGPKHVITAAHCLWDNGKMPDEVVFYPGAKRNPDLSKNPLGKVYGSSVQIMSGYTVHSVEAFDVGMVKFDHVLPAQPLPIELPSYKTANGRALTVAGYPGDKDYGTMWESKKRILPQWDPSKNNHNLDTFSGMSGAAMRLGSAVVGIHSSGQQNEAGEYIMNHCHYFTPDTLKMVKRWIAE
jgi:glutamyl endopeptidase